MKRAGLLTPDQRWLLWTVGLGISRALLSDEGLQDFSDRRGGYWGSARDGAPKWMDSYDIQGGKVTAPARGDGVRVTVTTAHIRSFRKTIPAALLGELAAIDKAETDERCRTELWCRCHLASPDCDVKPHKDFWRRDCYHPTDAEEGVHMDIVCDLRDREWNCLKAILGIGSELAGQLELFGASV